MASTPLTVFSAAQEEIPDGLEDFNADLYAYPNENDFYEAEVVYSSPIVYHHYDDFEASLNDFDLDAQFDKRYKESSLEGISNSIESMCIELFGENQNVDFDNIRIVGYILANAVYDNCLTVEFDPEKPKSGFKELTDVMSETFNELSWSNVSLETLSRIIK